MSPDWPVLLAGVVATGGAWWWVRSHVHPDLVSRQELQPQLDVLLADLRYLRERIDEILLDRSRDGR